ncbi:MAG: efflux transporter outer membrane subunit [Syntrophobacteraceae bacterium]|nr:efflux transporter outer membrane subunit [Syntrophobacteraceae bacterium]
MRRFALHLLAAQPGPGSISYTSKRFRTRFFPLPASCSSLLFWTRFFPLPASCFSLLLLTVMLSGCMVGPDYRRPAVEMPKAFHYEQKDALDTANTAWWKEFHDPVLDCLIVEALANNKSVKAAAANVEQAVGVLTQTRAPLFPQATYSGDAARTRQSKSELGPFYGLAPNTSNSFDLLAGATWEIDLWGRIRRLTESARANLLATDEARRGVILSLVASVAGSYLQLRGLDEQLEIARRTLATYGKSVKLFELQFAHGQVSMMTVEQARSQYENVAATIPQIESQIAQTENGICILLGRNPGPIKRGNPLSRIAIPAIPAGLPSQLLERRPDLAQAEQNLVAANAQIGAAKALYFPTISLTAALGVQSSDLSQLFQGPARTWSYAGSFAGPIFTAGAIAGQVKQARAMREAALQNYKNAILSSFGDVENSLVSRRKLSEQLLAQERFVVALKNYDRLAWMQYNGGYTSYLTVLNAEEQLFPAELTCAQVRASVLEAIVTIYKAMGGGWVNSADKLTSPCVCAPH